MAPLVRAGGGIILRDGRILVIHRPHYDDWSLPKGKLEPGESWQMAAVREVEEETGLRCEVGEEVARVHYVDRIGRNKEVRYYAMTSEGEPVAQNEIDEVRWVTLEQAAGLLSYDRDAEVLSRLR